MPEQTHPDRETSPDNDLFAIDVPLRDNKPAGITSISFDGLLDPPLLLHEDLKEGCGGQLWPAGMVLAKYVLSHSRHELGEKAILELGAGGGLVGLAVAKSCHLNIPLLITDQKPMLALMQRNIELNNLQDKARAVVYDWGSTPPSIPSSSSGIEGGFADVVLAADCVYFEPAFPLLLQSLTDIVGPHTTCYFCFKKRRKADWRFIKSLQKAFDVTPVPYQGREQDQRQGIYLFRVLRRKCK